MESMIDNLKKEIKKLTYFKRQLRQLDYISQFSTDIQYIRGVDNIVPDILSRIESISQNPINYEIIASQQEHDIELKQILDGKSNFSIQLNKIPLLNNNKFIYHAFKDNSPPPTIKWYD